MHKLLIDVYTEDAKAIVSELKRLKTTHNIMYAKYHSAPECTLITIETDKTEDEMDKWLYNTKSVSEYIGVTEHKETAQ